MTQTSDLTDWCLRERERLHEQLDALRDGKFCIMKKLGADWIDVTHGDIDRIEQTIGTLDGMLVRYGRGLYENTHHPQEIYRP